MIIIDPNHHRSIADGLKKTNNLQGAKKPWTIPLIPSPGYALQQNAWGLRCDLFISHAWSEGDEEKKNWSILRSIVFFFNILW